MNFDNDAPLNRISRETIKAHDAFMDYFLMGTNRSFVKLFDQWARIQKVSMEYPDPERFQQPTTRLQTLKNWSSKYQWQARIARQNAIEHAIALEQIEAAQAAALARWREQHMSEAEALAELAKIARGDMGTFANVRTQADLDNHPDSGLVKTVTQHYTQTERGEGDDKKSEIKARIILGLYNRLNALELILKSHGSFAADNKSEITMRLEESPLDIIRSRIDSIATNKAESVDSERPDNG